MNKKFWSFLLLTIFLLPAIVFANEHEPVQVPSGVSGDPFTTSNFNTQTGEAKPNSQIPENYKGKVTMQGSGPVKYGDDIYELEDGDTLLIDDNGNAAVKRAKKIETTDSSGEKTIIEDVEDGVISKDGNFEFKSVKNLRKGSTTIINGQGVKFKNGVLSAEKADSFIRDGSVTTNIEKLSSKIDVFLVEKADSFLSDCIRVDDIKDSEFRVSSIVEIKTKSDVNLKITDCSYNEVEFNGKGKVSVDKSSNNPKYTLENGSLTKKEKNYNETVESNNSIIIETDKTFGFKCLIINPVGSYFYNDKDLRKDFVINVPKESSIYKLCLRKNQIQQFKDYNGLVDFVNKKIELNGIVNYK